MVDEIEKLAPAALLPELDGVCSGVVVREVGFYSLRIPVNQESEALPFPSSLIRP